MSSHSFSLRPVAAVALVLLTVACKGDSTGPQAGPPTSMVVAVPDTAVVGDYLTGLRVTFLDDDLNVATSATSNVTLTMTTDPSGDATMLGTLSKAAVDGVAEFDSVSIDTPGSGFVLTASATSFSPDPSDAIELVAQFDSASTVVSDLSDDDDGAFQVEIGFSFNFYGVPYDSLWINTNGLVQFGASGCSAFGNATIPTAGTCSNYAAPLWDDLDNRFGGDIYMGTLGTSPNRRFVVEWRDVPHYDAGSPGSSPLQVSVVLYEGTNEVEFQYGSMSDPSGNDFHTGGSATIGFENAAEDGGTLFSFNTAGSVRSGRVMRFVSAFGTYVRIR